MKDFLKKKWELMKLKMKQMRLKTHTHTHTHTHPHTHTHIYIYIYINIYTLIIIKKVKIKLQVRLAHPRSGDSQGHETFLAPSADKQTRNYNIECSNHHPSVSTLKPKGLSRSKMKWRAIYTNLPYWYLVRIYLCW